MALIPYLDLFLFYFSVYLSTQYSVCISVWAEALSGSNSLMMLAYTCLGYLMCMCVYIHV